MDEIMVNGPIKAALDEINRLAKTSFTKSDLQFAGLQFILGKKHEEIRGFLNAGSILRMDFAQWGPEELGQCINKIRHVPEILAKAKEEGRLDPLWEKEIGRSAQGDAFAYTELMLDEQTRAETIEAIKEGTHWVCHETRTEKREALVKYYGLTVADIGKPLSETREEYVKRMEAKGNRPAIFNRK